jgi:NADPH:quinone reductase-like Zn-dependent oxidoreductase
MRAAVLHDFGAPRYDEYDDPTAGAGQAVVEVAAAGLNPIDLARARGGSYLGAPELPSVPGMEGVGTLDGRRVYFLEAVQPFGSMGERCLVDPAQAIAVPDGVDDATGVALGIAGLAAWLALEWRARVAAGETVLVLGATGTVGLIAVQAARLLGAGRVVAAGRDADGLRRATEAGADAVVHLGETDDLAGAFREAAGDRLDVVVDPLWGEPAVAALQAGTEGVRLVQIGQSAGAEATLPSAAIRGKLASILGHTNLRVPFDVLSAAYGALAEHAAAGRISVETEVLPLAEVQAAWERQTSGPGRKLVLTP